MNYYMIIACSLAIATIAVLSYNYLKPRAMHTKNRKLPLLDVLIAVSIIVLLPVVMFLIYNNILRFKDKS